ncbi:conserved exported hypothetical protein [Candidatus Methylobacter favarea]|uniref:Carboxypeptidase regulatory-like domain-containing protein n=1 Tax=Candidatus Methylobacter favarea TaxID=2707345 RepID=A0A8S0X6F0_9GAMM|nr:carboxypeptidase-like regulatory domain-containing protein [Candidatus Methylobacter favarea]CAA9889119.1 conserved exported hypothetical protein [Candidatus Methylobacter favarea]
MKRLFHIFFTSCFLLSLSAFADEHLLKPQSQGEVTFISGGVGENQLKAMQAMRNSYNLNLLFALKKSGKFIADVNVQIADAKGNILVETVAEGPYLFASLKPGKYIVTAEEEGKVMRQKARVSDRGTTTLSFYWPEEYGD